jgi:hypothetical protein
VIISFAWTTPALLAGAKTVTRRNWLAAHGSRFHAGDLVDAWDRSPRANGKKVATIRIKEVVEERGVWMESNEIFREGVMWCKRHGIAVPDRQPSWDEWWSAFKIAWHEHGGFRIEFELVECVG